MTSLAYFETQKLVNTLESTWTNTSQEKLTSIKVHSLLERHIKVLFQLILLLKIWEIDSELWLPIWNLFFFIEKKLLTKKTQFLFNQLYFVSVFGKVQSQKKLIAHFSFESTFCKKYAAFLRGRLLSVGVHPFAQMVDMGFRQCQQGRLTHRGKLLVVKLQECKKGFWNR